jgi:hypothetical protein
MTYDPNYPPPDPGNPYSPQQQPQQQMPQPPYGGYQPNYYAAGFAAAMPHSGLGIASFVIALIVGLVEVILVIAAAAMVAQGGGEMDEQSPTAIVLGCTMILGMLGALVGAILGGISVAQRERKRVFGILGLCFNIGILLALGLLMLVGSMQP